jgi:hypothetical protein
MVKVIIGLTTMMGHTFAIKNNLIPTSPLRHGVSNMEGFNNEDPLDLDPIFEIMSIITLQLN